MVGRNIYGGVQPSASQWQEEEDRLTCRLAISVLVEIATDRERMCEE